MESKFFNFIQPYINYIDSGDIYRKPFSWLYALIGGANLALPVIIFFVAVENNIFDAPAKYIITFLLVWLIMAFAGWVSFQLWWDRKKKIIMTSEVGDEFAATPVFSHLIQTLGEWIGTWVAIVGFGNALLTTIVLGDNAYGFGRVMDIDFLESGWLFVIVMPLTGFLIIVGSRFVAEQFRALASIANNTKK